MKQLSFAADDFLYEMLGVHVWLGLLEGELKLRFDTISAMPKTVGS